MVSSNFQALFRFCLDIANEGRILLSSRYYEILSTEESGSDSKQIVSPDLAVDDENTPKHV
jgi:hypothetical protein